MHVCVFYEHNYEVVVRIDVCVRARCYNLVRLNVCAQAITIGLPPLGGVAYDFTSGLPSFTPISSAITKIFT